MIDYDLLQVLFLKI